MPKAARTIASGIALSLAALLAAVLLPAAAAATTIFSDFGPGQSFNSGSSLSVNGPSGGSGFEIDQAASFQPSSTFTLTSIDLAISFTKGTDSFKVEIAQNASGHPGAALEAFTLSGVPSSATVETLTSILHPTLSSGAFYWIAVFPGDSTTLGDLFANDTGVTGTAFSNDGGSTWGSTIGSTPAFDVIGNPVTAVPEPSPALLLIAGLAALAAYGRKKTRSDISRG